LKLLKTLSVIGLTGLTALSAAGCANQRIAPNDAATRQIITKDGLTEVRDATEQHRHYVESENRWTGWHDRTLHHDPQNPAPDEDQPPKKRRGTDQ